MPDGLQMERPRACTNCSRAKAKCVWLDNDICQRCSRNDILCSKLHSVSKKRRGKATHARVLEQKLDDIMALLSEDREGKRRGRATDHPPFSNEGSTPAIAQPSYQDQPPASLPEVVEESLPAASASIFIVPGFQVSFTEANQVLQEYMDIMLPEFPFVPLSFKNSYDMHKDTPLLLKTILWVCRPPDPEASAAFESWFRQQIAHQTIILMNKNLELVQAILLFLAWHNIYFYVAAKDTSLLQQAIGLIEDLGLTSPQRTSNSTFGSIVEDAAQMRSDLPPQPQQTGAGHRALLGVYYITSTLCSLLGKRYRLEYTQHFEDCCKKLLQEQEYRTDLLLVNLVYIRKLAMKVHNTFWETTGDPNNRSFGNFRTVAVASIRNELDSFMQQLPDSLKWNHLLRTHCAAARIRLFEPFKYDDRSEMLEPTHLKYRTMWNCLESTQTLYDTFCLVPVESYTSLTFVSILNIALAIIKAGRLLFVEDQGWDLNTVQTMYNLPGILRQLSNSFSAASSNGSPRNRIVINGLPMLSEYADAYRGIERWYMYKLGPDVTHSSSMLPEPINAYAEQSDLDFWNQLDQLSDLTYGSVL